MNNNAKTMLILPSYSGGGAEKVIISYFLYSLKNQKLIYLFVANNVGPLKVKKKNAIALKSSNFYKSIPSLLKFIRKKKVNILISTFPSISFIIILLRLLSFHNCKLIIRQPNIIKSSLSRTFFLRFLRFLYKTTIPFADAVIVTSNYMKKEAIKNKIDKKKIFLIRNPVNIKKIRTGVTPRRTTGQNIKLIYVGRIVYQKGLDRIIYLLKKFPNIDLIIIGIGEEKGKLIKIAHDIKIENQIKYLGYLKSPYNYIAGADFFVLPSRWEGLPNSVLESLALGTPVITFKDVRGLKDFKYNISNKDLIICKNEKDLESKLKIIKKRKDYKKPILRKNLLHNFISEKDYYNEIEKIIEKI